MKEPFAEFKGNSKRIAPVGKCSKISVECGAKRKCKKWRKNSLNFKQKKNRIKFKYYTRTVGASACGIGNVKLRHPQKQQQSS